MILMVFTQFKLIIYRLNMVINTALLVWLIIRHTQGGLMVAKMKTLLCHDLSFLFFMDAKSCRHVPKTLEHE